MEKLMYMMMIEKSKTYNKMTKQIVMEHVENIRKLDDEGKLELCGVFKGYPGMAVGKTKRAYWCFDFTYPNRG